MPVGLSPLLSNKIMTLSFLSRSVRSMPAEHRANFVHLYLDIAWFGVLSGSAMAFIAVYTVRQGASAFQLGLLTAGPAIVNLVCALPAGRWLEKQPMSSSVFWAAVLHRFFYLLWVPLPSFLTPQSQIWAFIGLTLLMSIPGTALAVGFNALFADVVPPAWRGHVAGTRNALLAITFTATTLLCGQILIRFPFPIGYQIVFGIGFLGATLSSLHLWFIRPLPDEMVPPRVGRSLRDLARPGLVRLIGDGLRPGVGLRFLTRSRGRRLLKPEILIGPFGSVVVVLFAFHLAQFLAVPLAPLYWVGKLHLSDQEISLGTATFYVSVLLSSTQLARLAQRLGHHRVTAIGAMLMSSYPGFLALSRGLGLFLVASFAGGLGWSLVSGGLSNYLLERVPQDERPAHLAWYNLTLNAAILLGSLAGPLLGNWLGLSTALALGAIFRLLAAVSIWRWG
jgi:MFS family permease